MSTRSHCQRLLELCKPLSIVRGEPHLTCCHGAVSRAAPVVVGLQRAETVGSVTSDSGASSAVIASDVCLPADLYRALPASSAGVAALVLGSGWCQRWTVSWRQVDGGEMAAAVGELRSIPISTLCVPKTTSIQVKQHVDTRGGLRPDGPAGVSRGVRPGRV